MKPVNLEYYNRNVKHVVGVVDAVAASASTKHRGNSSSILNNSASTTKAHGETRTE